MSIEKEMAYILGAIRDGSFIRNDKNSIYRIRIYQKDRKWIETVSNKMEKLFGKKPTISLDNRDHVWNLMVNSREIYEKVVAIGAYTGSQKTWAVPEAILSSPSDTQKEFVKGFFDAEGGLPHVERAEIEPKDICIHFTQCNKRCLEDVMQMLHRFGLKTGRVCGPYYKKGFADPVYRLKIHGKREVTKFSHIIGSDHTQKQARLKLVGKSLDKA